MKRWQRIRVFILQGVNAAVGGVLIVIGVTRDLIAVAIVGGALVVIAAVLIVVTLRTRVTDPKPPAGDGRVR